MKCCGNCGNRTRRVRAPKWKREGESSTAAAAMRGIEPKQLVSLLHGDLDWITMKALEKDRGADTAHLPNWQLTSRTILTTSRWLHGLPALVTACRSMCGGTVWQWVRRRLSAPFARICGFAGG